MTSRRRRFGAVAAIVATVVVLVWSLVAGIGAPPATADDAAPIRIAWPTDAADALLWIALDDDAFRDAGARVEAVAHDRDDDGTRRLLDDLRAGTIDLAAVALHDVAAEFASRDGRVAADDPTILAAIAHVAEAAPATALAHRVVVARRSDVARDPDRYARVLTALAATLDATGGGTEPLPDGFARSSGVAPDVAADRYRATTLDLSLEWNVLAAFLALGDRFRAEGRAAWPPDGPVLGAFDPRPLERAASPAPTFPWLAPGSGAGAP